MLLSSACGGGRRGPTVGPLYGVRGKPRNPPVREGPAWRGWTAARIPWPPASRTAWRKSWMGLHSTGSVEPQRVVDRSKAVAEGGGAGLAGQPVGRPARASFSRVLTRESQRDGRPRRHLLAGDHPGGPATRGEGEEDDGGVTLAGDARGPTASRAAPPGGRPAARRARGDELAHGGEKGAGRRWLPSGRRVRPGGGAAPASRPEPRSLGGSPPGGAPTPRSGARPPHRRSSGRRPQVTGVARMLQTPGAARASRAPRLPGGAWPRARRVPGGATGRRSERWRT